MNMSFYTGAVGAYMQNQRMNVQANNIANVNNYGYKAERATFHHLMYGNVTGIDDEQLPKGTGTKMVKASVDYETGGYTETSTSPSRETAFSPSTIPPTARSPSPGMGHL